MSDELRVRERWFSERLQTDVTVVRWGVLGVPVSVSVTVAVQVVGWPTTTDAGVQPTLVLVERLLTVTVVVPELPMWVVSPL